MNKFLLEIITPKGVFLKDEVQELYLKTSSGYMGIMAKHDTLIAGVEIAPGFILKDNPVPEREAEKGKRTYPFQ